MKKKFQNLLTRLKRKIKRPPIYGNVELRLSLEFGLILSETAKAKKMELTSDIVVRAEKVLIRELRENGRTKTALNFTPLILAVLELK